MRPRTGHEHPRTEHVGGRSYDPAALPQERKPVPIAQEAG